MKTSQKILKSDCSLGYLLVDTISPKENLKKNDKLINLFLEKYLPFSIVEEKEKIYGKYSFDKLSVNDFEYLSSEDFYEHIFQVIKKETLPFFAEICREKLYKEVNFKSEFYFLNPKENKESNSYKDFPIWNFFYLYLIIDKRENNFKLIEFGYD